MQNFKWFQKVQMASRNGLEILMDLKANTGAITCFVVQDAPPRVRDH